LDIIQVAKLLELVGFLLASVFGGILLDEVAGGKVAMRLIAVFVGFSHRLRELTKRVPYKIRRVPEVQVIEVVSSAFLLWGGAVTVLVVGWLKHISVLLWTGVGVYSTYVISAMTLMGLDIVFHRSISIGQDSFRPAGTKWSPAVIARLAAGVTGVTWLILFAMILLSYFVLVCGSVLTILTNPRTPKFSFTILGVLMLVAGLILDVIAAF
jgi:hypothetical protein